MRTLPAPDLPACPCCAQKPEEYSSFSALVSYQCVNESCDLYPATGYHPTEIAARDEWLQIAASSH